MSQYNDIKITPNIGVSSDPKIEFIGAGNSTITLKVLDTADGGITFEGQKGDILSLIDAGVSIGSSVAAFSVNDFYGIPQIQAYSDGRVLLDPYGVHNVGIGNTNPQAKLDVTGDAYVSGSVGIGTTNIFSGGNTNSLTIDGKIVVGNAIGSTNLSNVLSPNAGTGVNAYRSFNLIDTSSVVKIVRTSPFNEGAAIELQHWNENIDTQYGYWDLVSERGHFAFRDRINTGNEKNRIFISNNGNVLIGSTSGNIGISSDEYVGFGTDNILQVKGNVYLGGDVGIGTTNPQETLDIDGNALVDGNIIIGSTIGAASTEKMEISAVSRDNGLLEIANYGGNQLFSVSNNQSESAFSVYRYANYDNLSITSFENRNLFSVSPVGIVTTYGALRVGTSITVADSAVYNELYGRLNVRAPFSTSTEYVSIVPKFSDKGALSFEAPVGTAQTDRGTQIFSISNNVDTSIFRVNDLNRQPIFEASASGNAGIGTTNPQAKLEVHGPLRVTSAGSTAGEQIDINYYRNVAYQPAIGVATDNRGAISFDSPAGISADGVNYTPASLFSIVNGGNVFTVAGYDNYSGSIVNPGIDVTVDNKIGIGTASPRTDFEIKRDATATGELQIQNRMVFSETINPDINSTTSIRLEPITSGINTLAPTRGSLLFDGALDQSLNGGQLVTVVNDNSNTLFAVNRFAGLSTTNVTGTRAIETVIEATSAGRVGIGTTVPSTKMDVRGDLRVGINTSQGLILTSPNGTTFRLVVDDSGNLTAISTTL